MTVMASVVLPVSNQADHIAGVVQRYLEALAPLPLDPELILVVNASRDASLGVCQGLASQDTRIRVVHLELRGWGRAVRAGLAEARGSLVCYTNSARTSGEDLAALLGEALRREHTVIKARRMIRDSAKRRIGSFLYNLECRLLLGSETWDVNGTPKVFPREFEPLLRLDREDDLIDAEFMAVCKRRGYPVFEVRITTTGRHGGKSTTGYKSAVGMYRGVLGVRRALTAAGRKDLAVAEP